MQKKLTVAIASILAANVYAQENTQDEDVAKLDELKVTASAFQKPVDEIVQPAELVSGEMLEEMKAASLGETIDLLPGIQSTFFGSAVGRPIIRGLEGSRVEITKGGLGVNDASTTSADHAVMIEPFFADQIEVLKGPSTLLYGSGAIGGVVNVQDGRIPYNASEGLEGRIEVRYDSVSDGLIGGARLDGANDAFAWHFDIFSRNQNPYEISSDAIIYGEEEHHDDEHDGEPDHGHDDEHDHEEGEIEQIGGLLENSDVINQTAAAGFAYRPEWGYIGLSVSRDTSLYGIPGAGHHHHEEDEHDDHGGEDDHEDDHGEEEGERVSIDMAQTRYDFDTYYDRPMGIIESARFRMSYSDYGHTEFEGDEVGTVFSTETLEGRAELTHQHLSGFMGVWGLQFENRDFSALGEEAFIAPNETQSIGLFMVESKELNENWHLEFGARYETVDIQLMGGPEQDFNLASGSVGVLYHFSNDWALGSNLAIAQRAPVAEELYSDGPHIATQTFELGDANLKEETARNIDLFVQKTAGPVTGKLTVYHNDYDDFITLMDTGLEEDELPVRQWTQQDATFKGVEFKLSAELLDSASWGLISMDLVADRVSAEDNNGQNLPRIAPGRVATALHWDLGAWSSDLRYTRVSDQDDVAANEEPTEGYNQVDADVAYTFFADQTEWQLFLRGRNVTDEDRRNHTSFLKESAPLPGRSFIFGVRAAF